MAVATTAASPIRCRWHPQPTLDGCTPAGAYTGACTRKQQTLEGVSIADTPPAPSPTPGDVISGAGELAAEYVGVDEIKKCVTGKSAASCAWAAVGLVPVAGKYVRPVVRGIRAMRHASKTAPTLKLGGVVAKKCSSFVPRTKVLMADGSQKPIEEVKIGDKVLATDPATGKTTAQPVLDTITSKGDKNLVQVTVDTTAPRPLWTTGNEPKNSNHLIQANHDPKNSVLIATEAHPFWVAGDINTWVKATDLKPGMWLRTSAGTYIQVTAVKHRVALDQRVHNLTIEGLHTYYVGTGTASILVHNCAAGPSPGHVAATADVSSTPNQAVFWSGLHVNEANAIARSMGGETLESLIVARGIAMPTFVRGNALIEESWGMVSARYAAQASGRVKVVLGPGAHPNTVWNLLERPTLEANPAVTQIDALNVTSGSWSTLFRRP